MAKVVQLCRGVFRKIIYFLEGIQQFQEGKGFMVYGLHYMAIIWEIWRREC